MGKRLVVFAVVLALAALTGCGMAEASPETVNPSPQATAGEEWGIAAASCIQPELEQSQISAIPEMESGYEAVNVPEIELPPASMRELAAESVTVWLDGTAVQGLLLKGETMVEAEDLTARWSWFRGTGDTESWTFSGDRAALDAESLEIPCVAYDQFSGAECVYCEGAAEEYWLPAEWVAACLSFLYLEDPETQSAYLSPKVDVGSIPEDVAVPVLMYHAVSDNLWGIEELFVSPEDMRSQLEYLKDNGYDPIFFSDLPNLDDYDKPIILTFDDGYDDNYTELFPILQEFSIKATVFVITGMLGDEHYMTSEQARQMSDSGLVDIQSHTRDHQELSTLNYEDQKEQMAESRLDVARITGKIPYVIAYPSGSRNEDTVSLAAEYYSFGLDMNGGLWYTGESWFKVDRIYISRWDTMDDFAGVLP